MIHAIIASIGFGIPAAIAIVIACFDGTVPGTLW